MATIAGRIEAAIISALFTGNCQFTDSEFVNVNMAAVKFNDVGMHGASVTNANMSDMKIDDVNLSNTQITNSKIDGLRIDGVPIVDAIRLYKEQEAVRLKVELGGRD